MAGAKETPRQKMVGLMYLVLMALLAMNVSKDILESFLVINDGLERSTTGTAHSTDALYQILQNQHQVNPDKVGPFWNKAIAVQQRADDLVAHLDSVKKHIIAETDKIPMSQVDTMSLSAIKAKDNYDVPTYILIGDQEDGKGGLAHPIKNELHDFSQFLYQEELFKAQDPAPFSLYDTANYEAGSWEIHNFYHAPLMASVSILSKLINDVRAAEFKAINRLYGQIDAGVIPFDTLGAQAIAESNYVVRGDSFSAKIFLGAFNKTLQPRIIVGEIDEQGKLIQAYDTVEAINGMANYRVKASELGEHQCNGVVQMMDDNGNEFEFPFRSGYQVFQPSAVVSADMMNVMYIGPDNPVSISVPGYSDADTRVTITGGNRLVKVGEGKYMAKLVSGSPRDIKVNVQVRNEADEWMDMGGQEFRAKPLPLPYATLSGNRGAIKMKHAQLIAQLGLGGTYGKNFLFNIPVRVTQFKMEARKSDNSLTPATVSNGNKFTDQQKEILRALKPGNVVFINDVKGENSLGERYGDLGNMSIEIIR